MKTVDPNSKASIFYKYISDNFSMDCNDGTKRTTFYKQFLKDKNVDSKEFSKNIFHEQFNKYCAKNNINMIDIGLKPKTSVKSQKLNPLKINATDGSKELPPIQTNAPSIEELSKGKVPDIEDAKKGKITIQYDAQVVGSFWKGIYTVFQMFMPKLVDLEKDQEEQLGIIWLPLFQQFLASGNAALITPFLVTITIFGGNIKKSRDINKEETTKPELEENKDENTK